MKRVLRLGVPAPAAILLRLTQFLVLACLGHLSSGAEQWGLIASFGVISAFGVLADSGAVNFLLGSSSEDLTRQRFLPAVRIHALIAAGGACAAAGYCLLVFAESIGTSFWLVIAFSAVQAMDSILRTVRAPLLVFGLDHRFAGSDVLLAVTKVAATASAFLVGGLWPLIALPIASVVVGAIYWRSMWAMLPVGVAQPGTVRRVLGFGLAGASSALYSQSPLLLSGLLLPIEAVATLSVAYRVVQPTEIVPATLAQQAIPRLRAGRIPVWKLAAGFAVIGVIAAGALWLLRSLIEVVLGVSFSPEIVLLLIVVSLPMKFSNYALTSGLYARGLVRAKLLVSVGVGIVVVAVTVAAAMLGDVVGVASVSMIAEATLMLGLFLALKLGEGTNESKREKEMP